MIGVSLCDTPIIYDILTYFYTFYQILRYNFFIKALFTMHIEIINFSFLILILNGVKYGRGKAAV